MVTGLQIQATEAGRSYSSEVLSRKTTGVGLGLAGQWSTGLAQVSPGAQSPEQGQEKWNKTW